MIESTLFPIVSKINEYLSNYSLIFLLVGVGLWYSIRTRFVQVRCFGEGMRKFFGELNLRGGAQKSGMTSFQALATAIAAQVGTGNIVGASGAILTGGPGAIFWMWVIAFFGMATIYAEATLAQKTRIIDKDGTVHGGPVYYITTAFKGGFGKFLATFFAVAPRTIQPRHDLLARRHASSERWADLARWLVPMRRSESRRSMASQS